MWHGLGGEYLHDVLSQWASDFIGHKLGEWEFWG